MTDSAPYVHARAAAGVATLTLDSPHNRNALSTRMIDELSIAIAAAVADPGVRVILLTHTGPVFCSGADLKETAAAAGSAPIPAGTMGALLQAIWEAPKPVVARVAGPARAGGVGLMAAADITVCVDEATFAFTEVRLGVVPAIISATVLPRMNPRAGAELLLTGDTFDGRRAAEIGLVNAAVPLAELDATVQRYLDSLVRGAPAALSATKQLPRRGAPAIGTELAELTELSVRFFTSADAKEGIAAYAQRRSPSWIP